MSKDVTFSDPKSCHFWIQNSTILWTKILWLKPLILFLMCKSASFTVQNFKKFLEGIQSYKHVPFLSPKWSICFKQEFFERIIQIMFIYLLALFIVENFLKNSYSTFRVMKMYYFEVQSGQFPKQEFFQNIC